MNIDKRSFYFKAALLLVLMIGMFLRIGAVLNTVIDTPVRADARMYYLYALNIDRYQVFSRALPGDIPVSDAFAPPLYPAAIAPLLEFPPSDRMLVNIGLAQALLGTFTILFAYLLFKNVSGPYPGLAAALLTAVSPHLISMTVYMLTETLFTFVMLGGLAALSYAFVKNGTYAALFAGVLIGLAALTRSTLEYFPLFILFASGMLVYFRQLERVHFRRVLEFAATALAIVTAWKLRNLMMTGGFSDPTLAISTLQHGMYPNFMYEGHPESHGIPYRFDPRTAEITTSVGSVVQEIIQRFREAPVQYLHWYFLGKPASLLSWSDPAGAGDIFVYAPIATPYFSSKPFVWSRAFMLHTHTALMLLGGLSALLALFKPKYLCLTRSHSAANAVIALLVLYFILLHMVGAPFPRYGIPLRPIMYGLAVSLVFALIARFTAARPVTNRVS